MTDNSIVTLSDEKNQISLEDQAIVSREPKRWYNTKLRIFGKECLPYNHATIQVIMVSFICFLCPGMFNALNSMGGNGLPPGFTSVGANSNVALYSTFAVFGFFGGTFINRLGIRFVLALCGATYAIYSASYLCFNYTQNKGFVIASGALLGIGAGILWAGQGVIMMSYATEEKKGTYISIFWAIFNVGAVVGSFISLGQNAKNTNNGGVNDGTYAAFLALMMVGALLALLLLSPDKVRRADGSEIIFHKNPTVMSEITALYKAVITGPEILLLWPLFFASNWFATYQFNEYNAVLFNVRSRALNSVLYYFAQIIGAGIWGIALDSKFASRPARAKIFHCLLFILTMAVWGGGLKVEQLYTREDFENGTIKTWDWSDKGYIGPMFLFIFYGFYDAIWQTYCYWLMGAMSNSPRKLAIYAGFYKGLQSAGAAVVWRLDATGSPFINVFASSWALLAGGLVFSAPMVWWKVKEHSDVLADNEFTANDDDSHPKIVCDQSTEKLA